MQRRLAETESELDEIPELPVAAEGTASSSRPMGNTPVAVPSALARPCARSPRCYPFFYSLSVL